MQRKQRDIGEYGCRTWVSFTHTCKSDSWYIFSYALLSNRSYQAANPLTPHRASPWVASSGRGQYRPRPSTKSQTAHDCSPRHEASAARTAGTSTPSRPTPYCRMSRRRGAPASARASRRAASGTARSAAGSAPATSSRRQRTTCGRANALRSLSSRSNPGLLSVSHHGIDTTQTHGSCQLSRVKQLV